MVALLITMQVLVALFLILVVLLQPGNKGGVGAALGGAGQESVFGARGANTFLSKLTFGAATIFMLSNISLSFMSSPRSSVLKSLPKSALESQAEPKADSSPESKDVPDGKVNIEKTTPKKP